MSAEHARAVELMSSPQEALAAADRSWLSEHVRACSTCRWARAALDALQESLRGEAADAPAGAVVRTHRAIRRRIAERGRTRASERLAAAAVAWTATITVAYGAIGWWAVSWLAQMAGLPRGAWWPAYASLWTLPCLLASIALVAGGPRLSPLRSVSGSGGGRT
jgi:anti-sigma factor RsiW